MRKLLLLASATVFLDVAFFAAIAPLLPDYVDELGLSKGQAGVLSAAYAAGTLVFSLPAGYAASRVGPRRSVIYGLLLLGVASLAFGTVHRIQLLDAARFTQGAAGALIWSGALTWLIAAAPDERRGSVIGTALGTAVAGALFGPAIGALAASVGTELVFGSVLIATVALASIAARFPDPPRPPAQPLSEVVAATLRRPVLEAIAFVAVPSLMFGATEVLVPLRIHALGGGHGLIAAGFIAGAGLEGILAPVAGRFSDRVGRRLPYVSGLAICALTVTGIALAQALGGVLAALVLTALGSGICFAPALTLLSDMAESSGLHQGFAAGLSNMAWAAGQVVGGVGAGAVAGLAGYAAPLLAVAVLLLFTVAYALRALPAPAPAEATGG